jgi:hypothetical protein
VFHTKKITVCLGLAVAGALVLVAIRSAGAIPPPPRFYGFMIVNNTGAEVQDITLQLTQATPGSNYMSLDQNPITVTISRLPAGKVMMMGTPSTSKGIEDIARVTVNAQCPAGRPLAAMATITAGKADYTEPPDGTNEYAGFCSQSPTSPVDDYAPTVEFRPSAAGGFEVRLSGRCRWGNFWSPVIENVQPFQH